MSLPSQPARALFLDRDGVVNLEIGYLHTAADVRWVEGIFRLARTASALGYRIVIVTNQSGIARGFYSTDDFHALMDWMRAQFEREGARLDGVYFCPFHPEASVEEFRREHEDRKPGPGMLRRAAADLGFDLTASVLVGDRCSDIAAARAAGLREAFLLRGTEARGCAHAAIEVDSLAEVERWLLDDAAAQTRENEGRA